MNGRKQMFCEVGTYRDNLVAILRVNKEQVHLNKTDLKELTVVRLQPMLIGGATGPI